MLVFEERGKPEFPEKNLSEQERSLPWISFRTSCSRWKTFNYTIVLYFYNIIDTSIKKSEQSQNMADLSAGYDHKQENIRSN